MDDRPRTDRTWLCSVLFADIVGYSQQSIERQLAWRSRLNEFIGPSLHHIAEQDRIFLDTGDGFAICFLGDPEPAMFCALDLLASLVGQMGDKEGPRARIGINLGPVRFVRDASGGVGAVGDGINAGERVMRFAKENEILVSQSYFEVVARLSDDYRQLFTYEGVRTDKHVREHTLYRLRPRSTGQPVPPEARAAANPDPPSLDPVALERIERISVSFLGPAAKLLVRRTSASAKSPRGLWEALLPHVPVHDREAFQRACGAAVDGGAIPDVSSQEGVAAPTPAQLESAELRLTAYLGPAARVVVHREARRAHSLRELYERLATHIPSDAERRAFRDAAEALHVHET